MPSLSQFYTGKEAAAQPYDFSKSERSTRQLMSQMYGLNTQRLKKAQDDVKMFNEAMDIDPIAISSAVNTQRQAQAIEEFITGWAQKASERGGKFTMNDYAIMTAQKKKLQADQMEWQAAEQRWLSDVKSFRPGYHDPIKMQEATQRYFSEGRYDGSGLEVGPMPQDDYDMMFMRDASKIPMGYTEKMENGQLVKTPTTSLTDDDIYGRVNTLVFSSEAARKRAEANWESLDGYKKELFLDMADANNDGKPNKLEWKNAVLMAEVDRVKPYYSPGPAKSEVFTTATLASKTPQSVRVQVMSNNGGSGIASGTRFTYGKSIPTTLIGDGPSEGVTFDYSGVSSDDKGWTDLPVNVVMALPSGVDPSARTLKARPKVVADGGVEWMARVPVLKTAKSSDVYRPGLPASEKAKYIQTEDGKWLYRDVKEVPVSTMYQDVSTLIDNMFPGSAYLIMQRGVDQGGFGQEGQDGSFFN